VLGDRIVARELPVLLRGNEHALGFVSGSIDLLYRDEDGRLVVVDYKTDRVDPSASEVRARRERYAQQGALYCRAVQEALGAEPPRFELWWLRSGMIEALPDPRG